MHQHHVLVASLLLAMFSSPAVTHAQVQYEPGYFIDNNNNRIECLIRDRGWFSNPRTFKYKLSTSDVTVTGDIASVKEFGVSNLRFVRAEVRMDTSSQDMKRLSGDYAVFWKTKTVFLSLIVDGRAKLYRYRSSDLELFFFSVDSSPIRQLIYKRFQLSLTQFSINNTFRDQIGETMRCNPALRTRIKSLNYNVGDLSDFVKDFNLCYQSAVVIDDDRNRTEGFIYTAEWSKQPDSFTFKKTLRDAGRSLSVHNVAEFSIGAEKYVRYQGGADAPSELARGPVFLRTVIDGPATLYTYHGQGGQLFLFSKDSSSIELLRPDGSDLFRDQLKRVTCDGTTAAKAQYTEESLQRYFENYNQCHGGQPLARKRASSYRAVFKLGSSIGADFSTIWQARDLDLVEKKSDPGYRLGLTAEFVMPFNKGKWSALLDPAFQSSLSTSNGTFHRSVEVSVGARHYFFLGENTAVFGDLFMVIDFPLSYQVADASVINLRRIADDRLSGCFAAGAGLRWKKITLECRYYTNRRVVSSSNNYFLDYSKTSVTLGYNFFSAER